MPNYELVETLHIDLSGKLCIECRKFPGFIMKFKLKIMKPKD